MSNDEHHLFGFEYDEYLHRDLGVVVDNWMDDHDPNDEGAPAEFTVTEWTSVPMSAYLPSAGRILENITEWTADDVGFEEGYEAIEAALQHPDVVAACEAMREQMRLHLHDRFRIADKQVGTHHFTFAPDKTLLCNGEPFYKTAVES